MKMNDTHGVEGKGWYGFDLDGTLAVYDKWEGIDHIGEPVKPMVDLMKKMHADGKVVKILTARVAPRPEPETATTRYPLYVGEGGYVPEYVSRICVGLDLKEQRAITRRYSRSVWTAEDFIVDWCWENLGFVPEITHEKDHLMLMLFDDRVKQVIPNEGVLIEDLYRECGATMRKLHTDNGWLLAKLESKRNGFLAGFVLAISVFCVSSLCIEAYEKWFGPEKEPARVRMEKAHDALCDLLQNWPVERKEAE